MDDHAMDRAAQRRLDDDFSRVGDTLGNEKRRPSFATYGMGLLSEGQRKSRSPIAARACADRRTVDAAHQRIHHFISNGAWDDQAVRRQATSDALGPLQTYEPVIGWIIDDTGFLEPGQHSVGVQRQYTGSAGKITICQVGVSLRRAAPSQHLPIDLERYLPKSWAHDQKRRREAKIPDDVPFRTKPESALDTIHRAFEYRLAQGTVLGDTSYGTNSTFRNAPAHRARRRGAPGRARPGPLRGP